MELKKTKTVRHRNRTKRIGKNNLLLHYGNTHTCFILLDTVRFMITLKQLTAQFFLFQSKSAISLPETEIDDW